MIALCKYPGGKRQLAPRLLPLIPDHTTYVEPFCGAAGLLFNKPRSPVEVLNDINRDLVNAFRCMRYHGQAVIEELVFRIGSRHELISSRKCTTCEASPLTDIQRAAEFLFQRAISFGSEGLSFGVVKKGGGGRRHLLPKCGNRWRPFASGSTASSSKTSTGHAASPYTTPPTPSSSATLPTSAAGKKPMPRLPSQSFPACSPR